MLTERTELDLDVFRRYAGVSLPRHVSYPMPSWWKELNTMEKASIRMENEFKFPLLDASLYLHIPFCEKLCRYCACTREIIPRTSRRREPLVNAYVDAIRNEIHGLKKVADKGRILRQIHWGGGTPTYLPDDYLERIHHTITEVFTIAPDAEIAMEIDPRTVTRDTLAHLRRLGFNRVSLGVQDFDLTVQEHVHRVQSFDLVRETVEHCREVGIESVNFDLIYGMPYQTPDTIRDTIEKTVEISPDRIAYYHYAQIPEKIATQRGMDYTRLPDSESKLDMYLLGMQMFADAGYEYIGLDHFAKPDELLASARQDETLQRNFQGMTTGGGLDLYGVGASSISHLLGVAFLQNVKETEPYIARMNDGGEPAERGKRLTFDDRVRQALINQLYCHAVVRPDVIERTYNIDFGTYFNRELEILADLEADGLVVVDADRTIHVTHPLGRVLMRNVAAVFDAYLDPQAYRYGETACFSKNA